MDDPTGTETVATAFIAAAAGGFIVAAVVLGILGVMMYRTGRLPLPNALVVSLGLLAAIALVGGLLADNADALTIAATGIGAFAGALSVATRPPDGPEDDDDTPTE